MIKRKLFDGKEIPAIGQGMGQYKYEPSQIEVIKYGIENGLSFIDTCEDYDNGYSEVIIGKAIDGIRSEVVISTKFTAQHSSYNDIVLAAERSLVRLRTDYIDIYQPHWPNPTVPIDDTLSAMDKLIKNGKIKYFGLGNTGLRELKNIFSITNIPITSVQEQYNLCNRTIEKNGTLEYCKKNKMVVIGYTPLDYGRIIDGTHKKKAMKEIADKYNVTIAQLALRWIIDKDPVIAIPKTSSIEHVTQNTNAMEFQISEEDKEKIHKLSDRDVVYVKPDEIMVSIDGEGHRNTYQTIEEAIENKLNFIPSPMDLSKVITNENPIKLVPNKNGGSHKYNLIEGRVRYWAWVLSHGNESIAAIIRDNT